MIFRCSSRYVGIGAAVLALSGVLVCDAQQGGKERSKPIEFSVPRSDEGITNLHPYLSKPDGLKLLEEDSYKPEQTFEPQGSLNGVVARPIRPAATPAIQSKRVKELLDRRKNWYFMSPEDLIAAPTVEETLKGPVRGPDGQEQKERPAIQRYYERMAVKQAAPNNPAQPKEDELFGPPSKSNSRDAVAAQEDANLPSNFKEAADALKKLFEPSGRDNSSAQGATHGNLSDLFGLGNNTPTKEQVQDRKKYLDEYQTVLDPTWRPPTVPGPGASLTTFTDPTAPTVKAATGLPSVSSLNLSHGLEAQADVVNPVLGPPGLSDVNAQALGQPRPTLSLPKVEARRVAPIAPSFDAPRRSFH
jgi:hypothetical protein